MTSLIVAALVLGGSDQLVIKDLKFGTGPAAKKGEIITVIYHGKLTTRKEFDSSADAPPFAFILGSGRVIKGWDQGLVGMKVGGKRKLTVPPELGFGAAGYPPDVPANAKLVFEVELLRIEPAGGGKTLDIKTLKAGTGKGAEKGDSIQVHYKVAFLNGKKLDASTTPRPVTLGAGGVVAGFDQGLLGIKLGEKRRVVVPFAMGYGVEGRAPEVPSMSTLVFELERVK